MTQNITTPQQPTPPVSPITPTSKPKSRGMLFMGGILILGLGFTIGLLFNKNLSPTSQISPTPTPLFSPTPQAKPDPAQRDTANWKTYTNSDFGFSFKYPSNFSNQGLIASPFTGKSEFLQSFSDPLTIREGTDAPFDGFSLYTVTDMNTDSFDQYLRNELKIMNENEFSRMQGARQQPFSGGIALVINTQGYYYLPTPDKQKLVVLVYLQANASFKPTFDQILSTFKFVEQTTLVPPDFQTQVSGARCAPVSTESMVTITIPMENVPQPRCVHVTSNQKLKIINNSQGSININVGKIQASLAPTQSFQFPKTLGEFLAPGGHSIAGAEIWLE